MVNHILHFKILFKKWLYCKYVVKMVKFTFFFKNRKVMVMLNDYICFQLFIFWGVSFINNR